MDPTLVARSTLFYSKHLLESDGNPRVCVCIDWLNDLFASVHEKFGAEYACVTIWSQFIVLLGFVTAGQVSAQWSRGAFTYSEQKYSFTFGSQVPKHWFPRFEI